MIFLMVQVYVYIYPIIVYIIVLQCILMCKCCPFYTSMCTFNVYDLLKILSFILFQHTFTKKIENPNELCTD